MQLHIYGPGGPYTPMMESALAYFQRTGIEVFVMMGTPDQWMALARLSADCIYGGAEYMMTDFIAEFPDMIDTESITNLHAREIGIIVRPGNPLGISSLTDLCRKNARVLDIRLEKMEQLQNRASIQGDAISLSVLTGKEGFDIWPIRTDIDAWITYRSWHVKLAGSSDFVRLPPEERVHRKTPIAIVRNSSKRPEAEKFIEFLTSESGHMIFQKWGWE
ncbi:MAG: hypothetical protein H6Q52_1877 [Deltaproteobacteria bacterium]|nr:hypothetical protein [Deltaproteobacteria bacterium]